MPHKTHTFIYIKVLYFTTMVICTLNIEDKNDKRIKQYMLDNNITNKGVAINKIIEGMK